MMRYVLCGIAALASTVALAEEPSYSFFQASYQDVELDNSNVDGNGLAAAASSRTSSRTR